MIALPAAILLYHHGGFKIPEGLRLDYPVFIVLYEACTSHRCTTLLAECDCSRSVFVIPLCICDLHLGAFTEMTAQLTFSESSFKHVFGILEPGQLAAVTFSCLAAADRKSGTVNSALTSKWNITPSMPEGPSIKRDMTCRTVANHYICKQRIICS